jgi:hypothetical protein
MASGGKHRIMPWEPTMPDEGFDASNDNGPESGAIVFLPMLPLREDQRPYGLTISTLMLPPTALVFLILK